MFHEEAGLDWSGAGKRSKGYGPILKTFTVSG